MCLLLKIQFRLNNYIKEYLQQNHLHDNEITIAE
jgi:hypothetical protein